MKLTLYLIGVLAGTALAYPGMGNLIRELANRQSGNTAIELIGDLIQGATTAVGQLVENCLLGTISCQVFAAKVGIFIHIGSC
jgi:hypothetical protein